MADSDQVCSGTSQRAALLLLRVATRFLLFWAGLNKSDKGNASFQLRRNLDPSEGANLVLGFGAGGAQPAIGLL